MNFAAGYVGDAADQVKILRFEKKREERRKQIEDLKKLSTSSLAGAGTRQFSSSNSTLLEHKFREETVGLVTKEEFIKKRRTLEERIELDTYSSHEARKHLCNEIRTKQRDRNRDLIESKLSFFGNNDDQKYDGITFKKTRVQSPKQKKHQLKTVSAKYKLFKNPDANTSFLPDKKRDEEEERDRERLRQMWKRMQDNIEDEPLEITYSYWDGTGHRRKIIIRKGDTIGQFLGTVQKQLAPDFREVQTISRESLMYVKEDIIVPHHFTFYELIINRIKDATNEKDDSHAGKVVERHWYDKNKHIFPASQWEMYDPDNKWRLHIIPNKDPLLSLK